MQDRSSRTPIRLESKAPPCFGVDGHRGLLAHGHLLDAGQPPERQHKEDESEDDHDGEFRPDRQGVAGERHTGPEAGSGGRRHVLGREDDLSE